MSIPSGPSGKAEGSRRRLLLDRASIGIEERKEKKKEEEKERSCVVTSKKRSVEERYNTSVIFRTPLIRESGRESRGRGKESVGGLVMSSVEG